MNAEAQEGPRDKASRHEALVRKFVPFAISLDEITNSVVNE